MTGAALLDGQPDAGDLASPPQRIRESWRNTGWYGARPLAADERFSPEPASDLILPAGPRAADQPAWIDGEEQGAMLVGLAPRHAIRAALSSPEHGGPVAPSPIRFVVATLLADDIDGFSRCAASVGAFFQNVPAEHRAWLVGADPSSMERSRAEAALPSALRAIIRWVDTAPDRSASQDLTCAAMAMDGGWFLFLGASDRIAADACRVLTHYIARFPACRFIVPGSVTDSNTIEHDAVRESGPVFRHRALDDRQQAVDWRRHQGGSDLLFETDFDEGCLIAIRHDLLAEVADDGRRWPTGCGFYGMALRAASQEPLLFVPDYLHQCTRRPDQGADVWRQRQSWLRERRAFLSHWADTLDDRDRNSPRAAHPAPWPRRGIVIVRTQGRRLDLLSEALRSISSQTLPLTACVVVHGSKSVFDDVLLWLGPDREDLVVLHAWQPDRRRGYPLNVGLDFARENAERFDFFSFLDDDDILYPLYAERLATALHVSRADVVYGLANQRRIGEGVTPGHPAKPASFLVAGNFIPIHAYAARISVLDRAFVQFREDMHYVEDWDFLLTVLHEGLSLFHLPEVLCEYRILGDGNVEVKSDPAHYSDCEDRVRAMAEAVARRRGRAQLLRDIATFDMEGLAGLAPGEMHHAEKAWDLFDDIRRPDDVSTG